MTITEEFNYSGDVPIPEYGNDGEAWHQTFLFLTILTIVPLIAFIISFFILYKFTKNKTRSLIGTIVGSHWSSVKEFYWAFC